mmetsp:Transcript_30489/g.80866  ORF Transcript_30489/g.80866 Transcript_30489/m.80866 type:complete len:179 (+) Transcript_30489:47-583(+)
MGGDDHHLLEEGAELKLDWHKLDKVAAAKCDVVPVAVQDAKTGALLILAYANEAALKESLARKVCCLWSTSRNKLWIKGETSGDVLDLVDVRVNCEQNSLLFLVAPRNAGACHTRFPGGGTRPSCYYRRLVGSELPGALMEHVHDEGSGRRLAAACAVSALGASLLTAAVCRLLCRPR